MTSTANPVVVVTGAAGGNGGAIARAFAATGAKLALLDRDRQGLETLADALHRDGRSVAIETCDVASAEDCLRACRAVSSALGRIDVLINNAGIYRPNRTDDKDFRKVFDLMLSVNMIGALNMILACREDLLEAKGTVISIASIESFLAGSASVGYSVSKGALAALTRAMAAEMAPLGVRVNAIAPGIVDTPMVGNLTGNEKHAAKIRQRIPMGRFARPEEVANIAVFLASPSASYINGAVMVADGGYLLT